MRDIERVLTAEWASAPADDWITKTDPADGSPVGRVPVTPPAGVIEAVRAARAAAPAWARTSPSARAAAVQDAARAVEEHTDDLAWLTTREMGRPVAEACAGVAAGIATLRQYAE